MTLLSPTTPSTNMYVVYHLNIIHSDVPVISITAKDFHSPYCQVYYTTNGSSQRNFKLQLPVKNLKLIYVQCMHVCLCVFMCTYTCETVEAQLGARD